MLLLKRPSENSASQWLFKMYHYSFSWTAHHFQRKYIVLHKLPLHHHHHHTYYCHHYRHDLQKQIHPSRYTLPITYQPTPP